MERFREENNIAQCHGVSKRKPSGGRKRMNRGKRRTEISSEKQYAVLGDAKRKKYRKTGASTQVKVLSDDVINVNNPEDGTTKAIKFSTVSNNPSNPNYVRRNILTKGAVVETELGKVRISSRPGQDGVINGTLIKE